MDEAAAQLVFSLASPGRFHRRHWAGEGGVLYDDADASLRILTPVVAELLQHLEQGSATSAQLAAALLGEAPEFEDIALVEQALERFVNMGLVCRVTS